MAIASWSIILVFGFVLLVTIGGIVGAVLLVRYLIRYNAKVKQSRTQQQEEMRKMKIDDL